MNDNDFFFTPKINSNQWYFSQKLRKIDTVSFSMFKFPQKKNSVYMYAQLPGQMHDCFRRSSPTQFFQNSSVLFQFTPGGGYIHHSPKLIEASLSARTLIILTPYLNSFSLYTTLVKLMYAQLAMYA